MAWHASSCGSLPRARGHQFTVQLQNDRGSLSTSSDEDGGLSLPTSSSESSAVIAVAEDTSQGPYAFVIYRAPADFARRSAQDAARSSRTVDIRIQAFGGSSYAALITIVRPPVVLVHGLWDNWQTWNDFSPLVTGPSLVDPRFSVGRANFGFRVGGISDSLPGYTARLLKSVRANSLGFEYNAPVVGEQIRKWLASFKLGKNPLGIAVASTQVDIVAHSMGGAVVRTMMTEPEYLSDSTFAGGRCTS